MLSGYPNSNYSNVKLAGTCCVQNNLGYFGSGYGWARTYLQFDLRSVEGKHILNGEFYQYFYDSSSSSYAQLYTVWPVDCCPSWSPSTVTWNSSPPNRWLPIDMWGPKAGSPGWVNVPVTSWVASWSNLSWWGGGSTPWDQRLAGIMVDTGGRSHWLRFAADESTNGGDPHLIVTYTDKPTASPWSPGHKTENHSLTPALTGEVLDPNGDQIRYVFSVCHDPAFTDCINSGWSAFQSGGVKSWTVPAGFLDWGQMVYWSMVAEDSYGAAVESSHPEFRTSYAPTGTPSSPASTSRGHSLTPTLSATAQDADDGDVAYRFLVCTDPGAQTCFDPNPAWSGWVGSGSAINYTVPSGWLSPDTLYYWRVEVKDPHGAVGSSAIWSFRTNTSPSPSTLSVPAADQVFSSTTPGFSTSTVSDPDADEVKYWFRVATGADAQSENIVANSGWITSTSWQVPPDALRDGLVYHARVYTSDWSGGTKKSQVAGGVVSFRVDLRLRLQGPSPYDAVGPVSVNLANGNLVLGLESPQLASVAGPVGLNFTYNSQAPATSGLTGTYYTDNNPANGQPDAIEAGIVRRDATVDFGWGSGGPGAPVQNDDFIAVWEGFITAPVTGSYQFGAKVDDKVKVSIDNAEVFKSSQLATLHYGASVSLVAGVPKPIRVQFRDYPQHAFVHLYVKGAVPETIVPASWFSTTAPGLPRGWTVSANLEGSLGYLRADVSETSVALVDSSGAVHTYTSNGSAYIPPKDEDGILSRNADNSLTFLAPDGTTYVFGSSGELVSAVSALDDRKPAAPEYVWSGSPARLTKIRDRVSGREVLLSYGGDPTCPGSVPPGFDAAPPAGMLCLISYWDGTATKLFYVGGRLGRIEDPGGEVTDFAYDAQDRIIKVRDSLAADVVAAGLIADDDASRTLISYDASGRVSQVTLPAPSPGALRPAKTYRYVSASETQVDVAGLTQPHGYARKVTFDGAGRTITDTDATGLATAFEWDPKDLLLSSTDPKGRKTTHHYDRALRRTNTYGPAPSSCFGSNRLPTGSCSPAVARTQNVYDGGISGLAAAYWTNRDLTGAPKMHATVAAIDFDWGWGGPAGLGQTDDFSGRYTGEITFDAAGIYQFRFYTNDGVKLFIDDQLIVSDWESQLDWTPSGSFSSPAAGSRHRIRIEHYEGANTALLRFYWTPPGGTEAIVPGSKLGPRYGLVTRTTVHDDTSGSPSSVVDTSYSGLDPTFGLPASVKEDPSGLALTTTSGYEAVGSGYLRQTSRQLPAGNIWTYSFYGDTDTRDNPCTSAADAASQGGLLKFRTGPDPDGTGSAVARVDEIVYDASGREVATRVGSGSWICTAYDSRGRVATHSFPVAGTIPARTATFNYAVGGDPRVSSVTDAAGTVTTTVDLLGRETIHKDVWGNESQITYDQAGRVSQISSPAGVETFTYDAAGRLLTHRLGTTTLATATYSSGELSGVTYGNQTSGTFAYDQTGAVSRLDWKNPSQAVLASDQVTRSQSGRVVDQLIDGVDPHPAGPNYTYDAAGRLVSARLPGLTETYGFGTASCGVAGAGKNGNRTSRVKNGVTHTSCYDSADRLTSSTDSTVGSATYDARGNTTGLGALTFTYDSAERLVEAKQSTTAIRYDRDATGRIVSRTQGSSTHRYGYTGSGDTSDLLMNSSGALLSFSLGLIGGVTVTVSGTSWSYGYPNVHGDVMATADGAGAKIGPTRTYSPFGEPLPGLPSQGSDPLSWGWEGESRRATDGALSLPISHLGARAYVPALGRFLQVDPVEGGADNDYAYAQDPVNLQDLDGTWVRGAIRVAIIAGGVAAAIACGATIVCGIAVGVAVGAASYAASNAGTSNFSWTAMGREAAVGGVLGGAGVASRVALAGRGVGLGGTRVAVHGSHAPRPKLGGGIIRKARWLFSHHRFRPHIHWQWRGGPRRYL